MASEEMSFENVDGQTGAERRRMPGYTISSPMSLRLRLAKTILLNFITEPNKINVRLLLESESESEL